MKNLGFNRCNFLKTKFVESNFKKTVFNKSILTKTTFDDATLVNTNFNYCVLDKVSFIKAKFVNCFGKKVAFDEINAEEENLNLIESWRESSYNN